MHRYASTYSRNWSRIAVRRQCSKQHSTKQQTIVFIEQETLATICGGSSSSRAVALGDGSDWRSGVARSQHVGRGSFCTSSLASTFHSHTDSLACGISHTRSRRHRLLYSEAETLEMRILLSMTRLQRFVCRITTTTELPPIPVEEAARSSCQSRQYGVEGQVRDGLSPLLLVSPVVSDHFHESNQNAIQFISGIDKKERRVRLARRHLKTADCRSDSSQL